MRVEPCDSKFCAKADHCAILAVQEIGWQSQEAPKAKTYRKERRYCVLHKQFCARKACNAQDMCEDTLTDLSEIDEPEEDEDEETIDPSMGEESVQYAVEVDGCNAIFTHDQAINYLVFREELTRARAIALNWRDLSFYLQEAINIDEEKEFLDYVINRDNAL